MTYDYVCVYIYNDLTYNRLQGWQSENKVYKLYYSAIYVLEQLLGFVWLVNTMILKREHFGKIQLSS